MSNITPIFEEQPDNRLELFEEFWRWYPHHKRRSSKSASRKLFMDITGDGIKTRTRNKDSGGYVEITLMATAHEIITGAKQYRKDMIPQSSGSYAPDTTYVPAAEVWLNGGRWEE